MTETYTASIDGLVARDKIAIEQIVKPTDKSSVSNNISMLRESTPALNPYNSNKSNLYK